MDPYNQPQPTQTPQPPVTPAPHFATEMPPTPPAPKRKRKGLWAGLITAGVLLLLGGGSVLAYNFWYQNPDKVIADGVMQAIRAKSVVYTGSYVVEGGDSDIRVQITGKSETNAGELTANVTFDYDGKEITVTGDVLVDPNGDLYVRVAGVDTLVEDMRNDIPEGETRDLADQLIAKINNQWVKISADDIKAFSQDMGDEYQCVVDTFKKAQDDDKIMNEIADVYKKHKFVVVDKKLGAQDGSLGYSLRTDTTVMSEFNTAMKETEFYKTLEGCSNGTIMLNDGMVTSSNTDDTYTEVWFDRWTHEITKAVGETDSDGRTTKIVVEPRWNEEVTITAPEASITLQQLQAEIMQLMTQAQEAAMMEGGQQSLENDLFARQP